jgi:hypothetical protein
MEETANRPADEHLVVDFTRSQLRHFREDYPQCRALQLPEGIMLRYTLAQSLYFYLRTGIKDGAITTRVFASDSPYDPHKAGIGEVATPIFEPQADFQHFEKLKRLLHAWVEFVDHNPDQQQSFKSFNVSEQRH